MNVSLSVLRAGYAPQAYFSFAGKVGKSALGRPQTPFFIQSDTIRFDTGQPLKYLFASGSLVIGTLRVRLRLTALVLMVITFC